MKIILKRVMIMGLVERVKSKIKKLIKQKGLSIYELAEKSDLTEACIGIGIQNGIIHLV